MPAISVNHKHASEQGVTSSYPTKPQYQPTTWRCAHYCTHHQIRHDVSHRSSTRSSVYQNSVRGNGPQTTINTTATVEAVCKGKIQPKQTKATDIRFHWLRDRQCQEQFRIYWRPGIFNYTDYWMKHHSATHHKHIKKKNS